MSLVGLHRFQVILGAKTNLPEDSATNTWYFRWTAAGNPTRQQMLNGPVFVLGDFYRRLYINGILSTAMEPTNSKWKAYRHGSAQSQPEEEGTLAFTGSQTGVAAPAELAVVSSFRNDTQTAVPIARRRGRVYIGPLGFLSGERIPNAQRDNIAEFTAQIYSDLLVAPTNTWEWSIYSKTQNDSFPVTSGWVENAWDVQRRRGLKATARETWTFIP